MTISIFSKWLEDVLLKEFINDKYIIDISPDKLKT